MPVFTVDSAADQARKSHAPGSRRDRAHPLAQIVDMQAVLERDVLDSKVSTTARAQVARAWAELEKLKRVMRGLPANTSQSIKSEPKARKVRNQGPVEPIEVELVQLPESPAKGQAIEQPPIGQAVTQSDPQPIR